MQKFDIRASVIGNTSNGIMAHAAEWRLSGLCKNTQDAFNIVNNNLAQAGLAIVDLHYFLVNGVSVVDEYLG